MTYSIIAINPDTKDMAVGVASATSFVAFGVPYVKSGVGSIVSQSETNPDYGILGLRLLEMGFSPMLVMYVLLSIDPNKEMRQVSIMDIEGNINTFTGSDALEYNGSITGETYSIQGNRLTGPEVLTNMESAYLEYIDNGGNIIEGVMAALEAGEQEGGDKNGTRAAGILAVKEGGEYGDRDDIYISVRVDDSDNPIEELKRLLNLRLYGNY
jgi:uncharacterized Ntn-hydrolase superfamily protein